MKSRKNDQSNKVTSHGIIWLIAFVVPCLIVGGLAGCFFYSEAVNDIGKVYSAWGQAPDWSAIRAQGLFGFIVFGLPAGSLGATIYGVFRWINRNKGK